MKMFEINNDDVFMHHICSMVMLGFIVLLFTFMIAAVHDNIMDSINEVKEQASVLQQHYDDTVYENELLWTYIENVDTFKSLDDAVRYRDDLIEQLQFIDE